MALQTERLASSQNEPHALEVMNEIAFASGLLWFLAHSLPDFQVVAKKSWALTDDFEAYFVFKGRLFVMETPFCNVWVSMIGNPADEALFAELEQQIQRYSFVDVLWAPIAVLKYLFVPFNPSNELRTLYGLDR